MKKNYFGWIILNDTTIRNQFGTIATGNLAKEVINRLKQQYEKEN